MTDNARSDGGANMTERNYELSNLMGDLLRAGEDSATAYGRGRSTASADEDAKKAMRAPE